MKNDPKDTVQRLFAEVTARLEDAALAALEGQSPWIDSEKARIAAMTVREHLADIDRKLDAADQITSPLMGVQAEKPFGPGPRTHCR